MARLLALNLYDGRSAQPRPVLAWIADGALHLRDTTGAAADAPPLASYPLRRVQWPERQRHGQRQAQLPDGGVLSAADAQAWDDWARAGGLRDSATVRWMQSWRHVAGAALLLLLTLAAGWRWGIPLAAEGIVALLPAEAETQIGAQALQSFDAYWFKPSTLPAARRSAIEADFARLVSASPATTPYRLHFRAAGKSLGPNALALPGGHIVLTDALVELLADQPDALAGVLAHELGHVQARHGMRLLVQAGLLGSVAGLIVGDFSVLLAGLPTVLGQQAYSRDFERQADAQARDMLSAAGRSPAAMLVFFERIEAHRKNNKGGSVQIPIALASHPAEEERKRFFAEAR
jgi:Zn-dependent protease with chaperone function